MNKKTEIVMGFVLASLICIVPYCIGVGCPIKFMTGISCGGCGMTRAVFSVLRGDIKGAVMFHPLIEMIPVYAVVYLLKGKINKQVFKAVTYCIVSLFIAVYIIRLISPYDSVVTVDIEKGFIFKITKEFL